MIEDYYQILGVEKNASQEEIKKAFHRLARRYHPDVNGPNSSGEYFKKITESYETLSDPDLRRHYDIKRMVGTAQPFKTPMRETVDFAFQSFSDFLNDLLFTDFQNKSRAKPVQGKTIETELTIQFADAYMGAVYPATIVVPRTCPDCKGKGWPQNHPPQKCPECKGAKVRLAKGPIPFRRSCKRCNGAGQIQMHPCSRCNGKMLTDVREDVDVKIPQGVDNQTRLRIDRKGASGLHGGENGDLIVVIHVKEDARFTRNGDDLYTHAEICISQLLVGGKIQVPLPKGHVMMNVPPGSELSQSFRIKDKGFMSANKGHQGDLYVSLKLRLPQIVPDSAHKLIRQLANIVPGF